MKKKDRKDVFDRIMDCSCLAVFKPFYIKYKEVLLYLFFGGLTFLVSIFSYVVFEQNLGMQPLVANIFSWILAVAFAYVTNRTWVFDNIAIDLSGIIKELLSFFGGRIVTLIIEEIILFLGITVFHLNSVAVKVFGQVVVIITNYYISKIIVFKKRR